MDASCLSEHVSVLRTYDDSGVFRYLFMKADEVASIDCQHGAVIFGGVSKNQVIRDALPGIAGLGDREYVVAEFTQTEHDLQWKILISV